MKPSSSPGDVSHGDVARGAGAAFLARAGSVFEVFAQPAYVWMFGLATYGLYTVLWSLVNLIENIADLGMTSALQRVVPQARSEEEAVAALRTALLVGVLPCILIALVGSLSAEWIANIVNVAAADRPQLATGIALFAWAIPLWALVEICTSAARARRAFGPEIRLRVMWEQIIRLGFAVPLWLAGVDTLGLLIAHLASLAITAAFSVRLVARYYDLRLLFRRRRGGTAADTVLAGLSVLPSNVVGRLFGDAPPLVLNLWFPGAAGAAAAGLYGIARKLSSLVQMIRVALTYVVAPLASAAQAHDRARIEPLYGFATRLATALTLPVGTVLIAGGRDLLSLFGPEARGATALLVPLVLARIVDAVTGPGGAVQQVTSARWHAFVGSVLGLLLAILLAFLLLEPLGGGGMAIAVAAGLIVSSLVTVAQLRIHDRLNAFRPPYWKVFLVSAVISGAAALLLLAMPRLPTPVEVAVYVAVLFATLWLSVRYSLPLDDRRATGTFGRRLRLFEA